MAGLCEGRNESPGSLKATLDGVHQNLTDPDISKAFGYSLSEELSNSSAFAFADDLALISSSEKHATTLVDQAESSLATIGLQINPDSESDVEKKTKSVKLMLKAHSYMVVTYEEELWPGKVLEVKNNVAVVSCMRDRKLFQETRFRRKRVTSVRDDHFIVLNTLRDRHSTAIETRRALQKIRQVNVSERTERRRLDECGLNSKRPAKGPELLQKHHVERLRFAHNHANGT
ncbi:hypothetical protein ANN_19105 [Periplaneta americana]|uniref:Reverse transcriptase domain-containing protein n=1 Tax=Periplaneta americana TaxID=6978 RepID=A0ABQ8S995_PERAM|nr:hypothetical protein ANN_19105 [Periplaneta americana]